MDDNNDADQKENTDSIIQEIGEETVSNEEYTILRKETERYNDEHFEEDLTEDIF